MQILGIIPARGGSKAIPKKNIKLLAGKPLIAYTIETAKKVTLLSRIIVSTDNQEIANVAKQLQIEIPFLRPKKLADDDTPMIDVIKHSIDTLKTKKNYLPDIIIILQPTNPFKIAKDINNCINKLIRIKTDSVISVCEVPSHFNPDWQLIIKNNNLQTYSKNALSKIIPLRQNLTKTYYRNGAIYAFWTKTLLEQNSLYGKNCTPYIMPSERSINIDTMQDWKEAEINLNKCIEKI